MPSSNSDNIDQIACDWVVRSADGALDPAEAASLERWLALDTRHRGAFVRAQAGWRLFDGLRAGAAEPVAQAPAPASLPVAAPRRPALTRRRMLVAGGALAASVAAGFFAVPRLRGQRYSTSLGEIRRVPLADGSNATINTASTIDVAFRPEQRTIHLVSGEAWFDVSPDRARPFVVETGNVRVRAVGTAFSVHATGQGTRVVVSEGTVEITDTRHAAHVVRVSAGGIAEVAADGRIDARVPDDGAADVERQLAWREGLIILSGTSIEDAAAQFNRYNARQISVHGAAGARRLTGVFRATDPEGFARAAAGLSGGTVVAQDRRIEIELAK